LIDIFVLSSSRESYGYVIAEAMASARPEVAFNVSSNPEIIEEGRTGFRFHHLIQACSQTGLWN